MPFCPRRPWHQEKPFGTDDVAGFTLGGMAGALESCPVQTIQRLCRRLEWTVPGAGKGLRQLQGGWAGQGS